MNEKKPEYLVPALIAGAAAGVLSAVPFVNLVNCLCCFWILGAGVLAAALLSRDTGAALTAGDGAIVGALTGIFAAVVSAVVRIPFRSIELSLASRWADFARSMSKGGGLPAWLQNLTEQKAPLPTASWLFIFSLFFSAVIFTVFGVLGGIIGISVFRRRNAPPAQGASQGPSGGPSHAA
jgi:hypothetical protein